MLRVIPSNKLENLFEALQHLVSTQASHPFERTTIVVQNQGIQHWINTRLAQRHGISFNIEYPMPVRFVWHCIRTLVGSENVDAVSPFSREPMTWAINQLLATDQVIDDPVFKRATSYWQTGAWQALKRFQLAGQLADLFEQYTIYRDDWLAKWANNQVVEELNDHPDSLWQAQLWRMLCERYGLDQQPATLRKLALDKASPDSDLPDVIHVFGINSLAPAWLHFLKELADKTGMQVFVYHLNPCIEYWGDLTGNRNRLNAWQSDDFSNNPLLANLGGQGQQFVRMLADADYDTLNLFDDVPVYEPQQQSLLTQVQHDLLSLTPLSQPTEAIKDNSLMVTSADSPLREIQVLHDQLLKLFHQDPSLRPQDVVVMCPQIEVYAPYIEAVFAPRGEPTHARLPCSIADRTVHESEPLVAQFIQLLDTPSRRYTRTEVLDMLAIAACQRRFGIDDTQLPRIEQWLSDVSVFWGVDEQNQQQVLDTDQAMPLYHWQQGLQRLMLGYLNGDDEKWVGDQVWSPSVDLGESELLGALINAVQSLTSARQQLGGDRSPANWANQLRSLYQALFSPNDDDSLADTAIDKALVALTLVEHIDNAPIAIEVVKEFLTGKFIEPSRRQQFLTGQVTFCSMMPMRSVPFKVVALLGLNDGEFPRAKPPAQLDLIAHRPRTGDRSRSGDDRYLFLEALISARQHLIISYIGRDRRKGQALEPSLVVAELVNYLQHTKGWQVSDSVAQAPLHPFDERHYLKGSPWQSYEQQWLRFAQPPSDNADSHLTATKPAPAVATLQQITAWLERPAQSFGRHQFELRLPEIEADNVTEPFQIDPLNRFKIRSMAIESVLNSNQRFDFGLEQAAGRIPTSPMLPEQLDNWHSFAEALGQQITEISTDSIKPQRVVIELTNLQIIANLPVLDSNLVFYRPGTVRDTHRLGWGLAHLIACASETVTSTVGFSDKAGDLLATSYSPIDSNRAKELLQLFINQALANLGEPAPTQASIATAYLKHEQNFSQADLDASWFSGRFDFTRNPDDEIANRWYWPTGPSINQLPSDLFEQAYQPLFTLISEGKV